MFLEWKNHIPSDFPIWLSSLLLPSFSLLLLLRKSPKQQSIQNHNYDISITISSSNFVFGSFEIVHGLVWILLNIWSMADWLIKIFFVFMKTIIIFIIIIITIITSLSRWSRLGEKKLSHLQKIFQNGSLLLPRLTPEDSGAIPDKDLQQTLSFNINGENFEMVPCSCQGLTQRTQVCL